MSRGAYIVRVFPDRRAVIGVQAIIKPAVIMRMLKSRLVAHAECGIWDGFRIIYARAHLEPAEDALRHRWQLGEGTKLIAGDAILFGQNAGSKAASCPIAAEEIEKHITWHPPLAKLGEALR